MTLSKRTLGALLLSLGLSTGCTSAGGSEPVDIAYDGTKEGFEAFVQATERDWPVPDEVAWFDGVDDHRIRYAHWKVRGPAEPEGLVVFFQGRTEFIEKNIYIYKDLLDRNYEVWTLDWRGQGLSDRSLEEHLERGYVDSFESYVADAERFLDEVVRIRERAPKRTILLAHSMGGAIGTLYMMRHPKVFDRAIFSAPMIGLPNLVDNAAVRAGNALKVATQAGRESCAGKVGGGCPWQSRLKPHVNACAFDRALGDEDFVDVGNAETYSHDLDKLHEITCLIEANRRSVSTRPTSGSGPASGSGSTLGLGGSTSGWLHAAFEATARINSDKARLETPLLILSAGEETIVNNDTQASFCGRHQAYCCLDTIEGSGHEILIETEDLREQFLTHFQDFAGTDQNAPEYCRALGDG